MLSEKEYDTYWSTGDSIRKALIDGAVRLLLKIDELQRVKISKEHNDNIYRLNVERAHLEKFLGASMEELHERWSEIFSDKYVYTENGRDIFFVRFGVEK